MNLPTQKTPSAAFTRNALLLAALSFVPDATFDLARLPSVFAAAPTAVWTPPSFDAFAADLRFAEALVERRLFARADVELARLETSLNDATQVQRFQYGRLAVSAAVESGRLLRAADRADVVERIAAARRCVEPGFSDSSNPLNPLDFDAVFGTEPPADAALEYAATLGSAFYELGVLDVESRSSAPDANADGAATSDESSLLLAAFETSVALVRRLPPESSRTFVYLSAKTLLARADALSKTNATDDAKRLYQQATTAANALCADADKRRDAADYFFARLLLVEAARRQGDVATATRLIGATLDDAAKAPNADDAATQELAVALVAEEIRLLSLESKPFDAARLASTDDDLLRRPTAPGPARFADRFFDVFADRDLARVGAFAIAAGALSGSEALVANDATSGDSATSNAPTITAKDALDAARQAADRLPNAFWRTRASFLLRETSVATADWRTIETLAEERFRANDWEGAVREYDRAGAEATAVGADADAFRLAAIAAGIIDKILRDKLFESGELSSSDADFWRRDAARRFEEAARSRPADELAPQLFLLALERVEEAANDAETPDVSNRPNAATVSDAESLRRDYLSLFPTATNRGAFANESARRALATSNFDAAAFYLDAVSNADPALATTLELIAELDETRRDAALINKDATAVDAELAAIFADSTRLLLAKISGATPDPPASNAAQTPFVARVSDVAQNLTPQNATASDDAVLTRLFELPRPARIVADAEIVAALETLLDRWETSLADADADRAAFQNALRASRLALRLDAGQIDAVTRDLAELERSTRSAGLETLERLLIFTENSDSETQIQIGNAALAALDGETGQNTKTTQDKRSLVRARALRLAGKTQESLTLFAQIRRKDPKNLAATRGIAEILTAQNDPKALDQAIRYWSDAADLVPPGSSEWWDAKERVVEIYVRTNRREQARKMHRTLWLTRSDPSSPGRRARWERLVGDGE